MTIEDAIRELETKLNNHYMVGRFRIENLFSPKKDKEIVQIQLWLSQLRDCEGDFTKMLRMIRSVVPVHWPVKLIIRTEI